MLDYVILGLITAAIVYTVLGLRSLRNLAKEVYRGRRVPHDWEGE